MNELFVSKYKKLLGKEFESFYESLKPNGKKYFRINTARKIDYLLELKELITKKLEDLPAYSYDTDTSEISSSISFLTGGIYIQNPSSLFPPLILKDYLPNDPLVLDLCSAPGGKTTFLSELLGRKGLIIANEISSKRLKALNFNVTKYGAYNVKTTSFDGRMLSKMPENLFDGVMLDAPCSNENKIFKNPEVKNLWSQDFVLQMQKIQKELIKSAVSVLKPGGYLIYSTCTFSVEENEDVLDYLLSIDNNMELIDINKNRYPFGLSGKDSINEKVIRVMPHKMPFDGFFIGLLKKKGDLTPNINFRESNFKKEPMPDMFKDFPQDVKLYSKVDNLFLSPHYSPSEDLRRILKFRNRDFLLGSYIRKNFYVSTEAVWEFGTFIDGARKIYTSRENALKFLDGYDLDKSAVNGLIDGGDGALFWEDIPVGNFKNLKSIIKNKIDRYFIYNRV